MSAAGPAIANVYLGTSEFAATVLRRLAASPHRPALVVAPPDRPRGRGRKLAPPPVAEAARELGLQLHQTANVNEAASLEALRGSGARVGAICAFGQLIKEPLLSELPMLNVHPSLLPRWRGAAPIERAIMAGDATTGACVMRLTAGLDSGPVALCEEVTIGPADDFGSLSARLAALGGELLVRALDLKAGGDLDLVEQDDAAATYAEKIDGADRRLDLGRPAAELERAVRALNPHVGADLELIGGERLGVRAAAVAVDALEPGTCAVAGERLLVGTADGALELIEVQPAGGRPMASADYLRGHGPPEPAAPA